MVQNGEIKVLNVAEKPSVARALAQVFRNCSGPGGAGAVRDRGSQRDVHELFTQENVHFPNVLMQGDGRTSNGPRKFGNCVVRRATMSFDMSFDAMH